MIETIIKRSIGVVLAMAILTDVALMARIGVTHRQIQAAVASFERNAAAPPPPLTAWTVSGERVVRTRGAGVIAVRYASSTCAFSTNDPVWEKLSARLKGSGVQVVVLLPGAKHEFTAEKLVPKSAPQALFVSADWARRYALTVTPTVLIFDVADRLVWHRRGVLNAADADDALEAVAAARRRL